MPNDIDTPHFKQPFTRGTDGKVQVVEQDSTEHVDSCIEVIARCPIGFRVELPEYGVPTPIFQNIPLNPDEFVTALRRWEPRAQVNGSEYADQAAAWHRHLLMEISHGR